MREILQELHRLLDDSEPGTLVTVVRTTGSAYRKEGAKMICREGARLIGSISGGCLESDVYERSLRVMERKRDELATYDTNAENDNVWGLGIGCNGTVEVLIESIEWWRTTIGREVLRDLGHEVREGRRCALITVLDEAAGDGPSRGRLFVDAAGRRTGGTGDAELDDALAEVAVAALRDERSSRTVEVVAGKRRWRAFVDALLPPLRLLVFGAGHDAVPLVRMARDLGMVVTVIDSRPQFATQDRFPEADRVICVEAEQVSRKVSFAGRPAVLLVSHHYLKDQTVLRQILEAEEEFEYVGALGPRVRTERMIDELRRAGVAASPEKLDAIRAPIGLDLGSESPAEIALSVLAEILAVKNRRSAQPLRQKKSSIHEAA